MKKFLLFIILFAHQIGTAQSDSYNSNMFTDSPITLSSGHYSFNLPLFNKETANSLVNLNAQLNYHSKSVRSIYSGSMFGNGFSLNILPVISRTSASDEDQLPSLTIGANGTNPNPDVYSYNVFGLSGKFFVYVENSTLKAQIVEQNEYAQIKISHETSGSRPFSINTYGNMYFTIIDRNGTEYLFKTKETRNYTYTRIGSSIPTTQNRFLNIYLTSVTDKSKKELLSYVYSDRELNDNTLKQISEIRISNYGKVRFNIENATVPYITSLQLYNEFDQLEQTIQFQYSSSHLNTKNLWRLIYKDPNDKKYYYELFYTPYVGTLDQNGYYWSGTLDINNLPFGVTTPTEFSKLDLLKGMTSGALNRVILPTGGSVNFTYEVNDVTLEGEKRFTTLADNYDFVETPVTISSVMKSENGALSTYKHYTFTLTERNRLFYKIRATGTTIGGGSGGNTGGGVIGGPSTGIGIGNPDGSPADPVTTYPSYKIYSSTSSTPRITGTANDAAYKSIILEPGTYYLEYKSADDSKFTERSLKLYTRKTTGIQDYVYAPGIRIKSIKETAGGKTKSETIFHYKSMADLDKTVSSGYNGYGSNFTRTTLRNFMDKNKEFVYYQTVTKEIKGKGFIEYDFGDKIENDSLTSIGKYDNIRKFPKRIRQYDLNKKLTEEVENNYDFEYQPLGIDESSVNVKPQGILKSQTSDAKSYVNNQLNGQINKVSNFSTEFRVPLNQTVTNATNGEVTKTESSYQKLGNEVMLTNWKTYLNNNLLYERKYNYVQQQEGTSVSFYHLSSFSEENKFGEVINSYEVTKTDSNGNVLEYKDHLGVYHVIVWGYNDSKKLFEIADIRYSALNASTITGLQLFTSARPIEEYQDPDIIAGLYATLRAAHPDKLITTYTYNIGKGLCTVTDPNGRTTYYEYDTFGRLKAIKDQEDNYIKTYQYNFINGVN